MLPRLYQLLLGCHSRPSRLLGLATFDWRQILGTFGNNSKSTHEEKTAAADRVYLTRHSNEWRLSYPTQKAPCRKLPVNSALIRSHRRTGRITKWRQSHKSLNRSATTAPELSEDQKLIKRLQKELKDAQLERDILKKAVGTRCPASSPGATARRTVGNIPIYSGTCQSVSR